MGRCKVAIIGGGPKGIYGFERLTAWLKIHPSSQKPRSIFLTDRIHLGQVKTTGLSSRPIC